jgi:hypothetical protein
MLTANDLRKVAARSGARDIGNVASRRHRPWLRPNSGPLWDSVKYLQRASREGTFLHAGLRGGAEGIRTSDLRRQAGTGGIAEWRRFNPNRNFLKVGCAVLVEGCLQPFGTSYS